MSQLNASSFLFSRTAGFYDFPIEQSLRFNDNDTAYLSRTNGSSPTDNKKGTLSVWLKRGHIGDRQYIIETGTGASNDTHFNLHLSTANQLNCGMYSVSPFATSQVFRDVSAWYHLVFAFDSAQAVASDRRKLYINGVQVTDFASNTDIPLNTNWAILNSGQVINIGRHTSVNDTWDGYMAEFNLIDGQALDPTSFGEFKSGIWIPKDTSGLTFGTNGFRLQYGDSAAIGDDTSGNTNDWTVNNLVASDVVLDSPTNNWSTLEGIQARASYGMPTLSQGNLQFGSGGISTSWGYRASNMEVSSGKWYAECRTSGNTYAMVGVFNTGYYGESHFLDQNPQNNTGGWMLYMDGATSTNTKFDGSTAGASFTDFNDDDIMGIALDADNGTVKFYVNGTLQTGVGTGGTVDISEGTGDAFRFWSLLPNGSGTTFRWNFGQDSTFAGNEAAGGNADENGYGDFAYAPPSGFLSLCSANLPSGAIDTLNDETPEDYFNTLLWTGDGSNPRTLSGLDFAPDLIWHKARSSASINSHVIQDSVRGFDLNNNLYVDLTASETAYPNRGVINSVNSTGFTFNENASDYSAADGLNQSGVPFVAWNWKAGGTGVSNTDGSITSTVSVGATSQQNWFSVVSYTGTGANATVGHGLGVAPQLYIVKYRNAAGDWKVYSEDVGNTYQGFLNDTSAFQNTGASIWNNTSPTSSVFSIGTNGGVNTNGGNYIAYCFADAEGLCKVGSYTGNGSADGVFVYLGFRPAFLLYKQTTAAANWEIIDNTRNPYNVSDARLFPSNSSVESTSETVVDLLSNGFKARDAYGGWNSSGQDYIYLAIAEQPFKYANAR